MSGNPNLRKLLATDQPAELGPGPRPGRWPTEKVTAMLKECSASIAPGREPLVRALVLLWHDHFEAAHLIVQDLADPDGAFVHGILHRREPDYSNAKYWFRRVGTHPAFAELAKRVSSMLAAAESAGVRTQLLPRDRWDPFAFVDLCQRAAGQPKEERWLRQIQRLETETLLDHFGA